ncbi:YqhA family protein [candidate division KSB1 bacterium]|nr:YqhA family protein [candidate division KSB1 bacterium]
MELNKKTIKKCYENVLESFLWNFRIIIILGVIGLLAGSAVVFVMGLLETVYLCRNFIIHLVHEGLYFEVFSNEVIVVIITIVDDFLLGIVLLIFGLGIYDLFISHIEPAERQNDVRPDWLIFGSLEEFKNVLGKVIMMILIINFLRFVVGTDFVTSKDILFLGLSIAAIAAALRLSLGRDIDKTTFLSRRVKNKDSV